MPGIAPSRTVPRNGISTIEENLLLEDNRTSEFSLYSAVAVSFLLVLSSAISHQSGLDLLAAKAFYRLEGSTNGFAWEHSFWLDNVLHKDGRILMGAFFFINLGLLIGSFANARLALKRKLFLYVALSTGISMATVSLIKQATTLPCPKDLVEFGGTQRWTSLWQVVSPHLPHRHCFPAGHASGGYAWLCLAFSQRPDNVRFYLLMIPGLLLGGIFGIAQQLRGAHFLSHDLMTAALCWLIASVIAYFLLPASGNKA